MRLILAYRLISIHVRPPYIIYSYSAIAKSERYGKQRTYHVLVRIKYSPVLDKFSLHSYSCECEGFLYRAYICKHVRELYNIAVLQIKSRGVYI